MILTKQESEQIEAVFYRLEKIKAKMIKRRKIPFKPFDIQNELDEDDPINRIQEALLYLGHIV